MCYAFYFFGCNFKKRSREIKIGVRIIEVNMLLLILELGWIRKICLKHSETWVEIEFQLLKICLSWVILMSLFNSNK